MVFALLAVLAGIAFVWRTFSKKFKEFHAAGDECAQKKVQKTSAEVSFASLLKEQTERNMIIFLMHHYLHVCWNLLANTFGQFQTYILVKANAQSLATGCGIVLNIVGLILRNLICICEEVNTETNSSM